MAAYVIMEPQQKAQVAGDAVFIRDGFTILALIAPLLWLLWHRLWIEAALVLGASLVIGALTETGSLYASLLSLPVAIYMGLEGAALRINALRRRGWRDAAVVEADSPAEAEIRYYSAMEAEPVTDTPPTPEPAPARRAPSDPALGLFSYPGGR